VGTEDQLADIFTKPLDEARFCKLRMSWIFLTSPIWIDCTPTTYDMPLLWQSNDDDYLSIEHKYLTRRC
jgi:hypothetical protein